jgi:5'-nucleotidase
VSAHILARRLLAGATATGVLAAPLAVVAVTAAPANAAVVPVTIIDFNDFHGRIDNNTTKWATTIEQNRGANTLLVAAGDNFGASLFASAFNDDKPTIDVLNALDVDVSAVGNHEFDKGFAWFKSHVVDGGATAPDGTAYPKADFPYLGANVVDATGNPVLPASAQMTLNGANVCVIGAVTQETPTLVSPGGVAGLTFTDPVAAVNKEVARLEAAAIDCDATIATYHEGAPKPASAATQPQQEAESAVFRHITQDTVAAVDVIYNGHTHQKYAYNNGRPVIQAGNYGESIGRLDMNIDTDTNSVSVTDARVIDRVPEANTLLPRVAAVKTIVDAAIAAANVIGDRKVGTISADITRADADLTAAGVQEDRGAESTIGNLVADALREVKIPAAGKTPTIGITNPGGLRADLLFKGDLTTSPENADGVVTFEEANAVLPFVNNVSYVDVTGTTLKKILEQQWQPASASRPFLALGVSKNVQTILDPSRPAGDRVVSMTIDGVPVDPAKTYTISTFSFLAQGGDNFTAFTEGKSADTGAIDRDLWIDGFFKDGTTKSPSPIKRQIFATGLKSSYKSGERATVVFDKLNINSLGIAPNTRLDLVKINRDNSTLTFGSTPITNGQARAVFTVRGGKQVSFVAQDSKTTVTRAVTQTKPTMATKVFPKARRIHAKKTKVRIKVKLRSEVALPVKGRVKVKVAGHKYNAKVKDGVAKIKLRKFGRPGKYRVVVQFKANDTFEGVRKTFTIRVKR